MSGYVLKAAETVAEATVEWRRGYLEPGEFVDGDLGWSVSPTGPRIISQRFDEGASHARVAAGRAGQTYMLAACVLTNTGRTLERSLVLRIAA